MILVGIDGTGPEYWNNDPKYAQDFADSHVNHLMKNWQWPTRSYHRGPTLTGKECRFLADFAYSEVLRHLGSSGSEKPVFLAGYSRGGACVIEAAKFLKYRNGQKVKCLILFDPVDRAIQLGSGSGLWQIFGDTKIPDTVENVIYAQRKRETLSRESFGNCGTQLEDRSKTRVFHKSFFGTHGSLGGCPFKIPSGKHSNDFVNEGFPDMRTMVQYAQDKITSNEVRRWMHQPLGLILSDCIETGAPKEPNAGKNIIPIPGMNQEKIHVVKPGDWLSNIAIQYYNDVNKWQLIYEKNKGVIGPNPHMIKPGQQLVIP